MVRPYSPRDAKRQGFGEEADTGKSFQEAFLRVAFTK